MPQKTKIIFITVFALVGLGFFSFYLYKSRLGGQNGNVNSNTNYQPFSSGNLGGEEGDQNNTLSESLENTISEKEDTEGNILENKVNSRFRKIADLPVAGATFFEDSRPLPVKEVALVGGEKPKETVDNKKINKPEPPKFELVPSIRYVEKTTGHVNQMYMDTKASAKISNSTIPNIHEAIFDGKASSIIYRYLGEDGKTITSFLAKLGGTQGEFLPLNILDISISPDKSKFFYLTETQSGVTGTIRSFSDTKKTQIMSSPLTELISQWVTDQKIYLTTKASYSVNGSLFSLNTTSGVITKVFGGVKGLTTLSNKDGSVILYSTSTNSGPSLSLFNSKNQKRDSLEIYGLPEKCVWMNDNINIICAVPNNISEGSYPDIWYQGIKSFNDSLIRIDTGTLQKTNIVNSDEEIYFDAINLFLNSKDGKQLFFTNKKDGTLWSLDL